MIGIKNSNKKIKIGILIGGGVGDIIYKSVYVKELYKYLDHEASIDIIGRNKHLKSLNAVFYGANYINKIISKNWLSVINYDLYIKIDQLPQILWCKEQKIKSVSKKLFDLIKIYKKFKQEHPELYKNILTTYTKFCLFNIIQNKKLVQSTDIENVLKIPRNCTGNICINSNIYKTFRYNYIFDEKYITIARDVDANGNIHKNVRLWSCEYFETLIKLIKSKYPQLKFVQIGTQRAELIKGIDLDLRGKTSLETVKAVLKHSLLHIDGECGMVHLKHYLNGTSVVLFGQTSIEFKGYENNINLKSDACPHWCEWLIGDWQNHCIREFENPPCMQNLIPQYVFENIIPYLDKIINENTQPPKFIETKNITDILNTEKITGKKIIFYGKEFLEIAKEFSNSNDVTILDHKFDYEDKLKFNNFKVKYDFSCINNIMRLDKDCDIFVVTTSNMNEKIFIKREIERVTKEMIILIKSCSC